MPGGPQDSESLSTGNDAALGHPTGDKRHWQSRGDLVSDWGKPSRELFGLHLPQSVTPAPPRHRLSAERIFVGWGAGQSRSPSEHAGHGLTTQQAALIPAPCVTARDGLSGTRQCVISCAPALSRHVFALGWRQLPSAREPVRPVPSFAPARWARHACEEAAAAPRVSQQRRCHRRDPSGENAGIAPRLRQSPVCGAGAEAAPWGGHPARANKQPRDRPVTDPAAMAGAALVKGLGWPRCSASCTRRAGN